VTTTEQRAEADAALEVQRADALGGVELVSGKRQHVDRGVGQIHRDLADRLHRVGVEKRTDLLRHDRQLLDREDGPRLVVGPQQSSL
jgi:hypothetical protein